PDNSVALAEKALYQATQGDPLGGVDWLQRAIEACGQEMPARVYDAIGALGLVLLSAGHVVPARAHLQLQLGIGQGKDQRAVSTLLQVEASPSIHVLLKYTAPFEAAPAGVPWAGAFAAAMEEAHRGHWKKGAEQWNALTGQAGNSPALWKNL